MKTLKFIRVLLAMAWLWTVNAGLWTCLAQPSPIPKASAADVQAGTNNVKYITPYALALAGVSGTNNLDFVLATINAWAPTGTVANATMDGTVAATNDSRILFLSNVNNLISGIFSGYYKGNGAELTNIPGASVTGDITNNTTGNAATATTAMYATNAMRSTNFLVGMRYLVFTNGWYGLDGVWHNDSVNPFQAALNDANLLAQPDNLKNFKRTFELASGWFYQSNGWSYTVTNFTPLEVFGQGVGTFLVATGRVFYPAVGNDDSSAIPMLSVKKLSVLSTNPNCIATQLFLNANNTEVSDCHFSCVPYCMTNQQSGPIWWGIGNVSKPNGIITWRPKGGDTHVFSDNVVLGAAVVSWANDQDHIKIIGNNKFCAISKIRVDAGDIVTNLLPAAEAIPSGTNGAVIYNFGNGDFQCYGAHFFESAAVAYLDAATTQYGVPHLYDNLIEDVNVVLLLKEGILPAFDFEYGAAFDPATFYKYIDGVLPDWIGDGLGYGTSAMVLSKENIPSGFSGRKLYHGTNLVYAISKDGFGLGVKATNDIIMVYGHTTNGVTTWTTTQ